MSRRYTLPAGVLFVPADVARGLAVLLEPGRRTFEATVGGHADLRAWLAELDALVPSTPLPRPETVWITTAEAAELLGVTPRHTRSLAGKIRAQRRGRVLVFDLADVLDEAEARSTSPSSPAGSRPESPAA